MLDYGAYLWGSTYEDFEAKVLPYLKKTPLGQQPQTLAEAAATRLNLEEVGGAEGFAEAVRRNLADGTFIYAVVARTLPATLGTVLHYLAEVSRLQTAAITVDYFQDQDRRIMVPRVAFAYQRSVLPSRQSTSLTGTSPTTAIRTTPEQFLEAVGPASSYWEQLVQYMEGLPGKFFWGSKGFSYRIVYDGKQYPIVWGYPRTVWWLKSKSLDELRVLVEAEPGWPESLRARVEQYTKTVLSIPGAQEQSEGSKKLAVFYISDSLSQQADASIREVLRAAVTAHAPNE
jgi:hypothetical protein